MTRSNSCQLFLLAVLLLASHVVAAFPWTTPQQNDVFLQFLVTTPPVGINIFSHYNSVAKTVPDARGNTHTITLTGITSPAVTITTASFNAVNPVTSVYGDVDTGWGLTPPPNAYTWCWVSKNGDLIDWVVACFANTTPFTHVIDQTTIAPPPDTAAGPVDTTTANYLHSIYTWGTTLSTTDMKLVTMALRKEIGGVPRGGEPVAVVHISDPRAYYMRFLIALRPPQSINIFADLNGTIIRNRMGPGFEARVTAGTARKVVTTGALNGANSSITTLQGTTLTTLLWPVNSIPLVMTVCTVSRYWGVIYARVFNCWNSPDQPRSDCLFGHYQQKRGIVSMTLWKTKSSTSVGELTDWLVMCSTSRGAKRDNIIMDQLDVGTDASATNSAGQLNVNYLTTEPSNFDLHSLYVWNAVLNPVQMKHVTLALRAQLGGTPDIGSDQVGPPVIPMTPSETAYEQVCPAGTYADAATTTGDCTSCAAGTYNKFIGQSTCTPCPAGTYNEWTGQSTCTPCGAGTSSSAPGAISAATCTPCTAVGAYSASGASACSSSCPAGTYNTAGVHACTDCIAGTYSTATAATSASVCTNCIAGTYSAAGASACTNCTAGTYGAAVGAAISESVCTTCPAGTSNAVVGATSSDACIPCRAGTYGRMAGMSVCADCISGKYSTAVGQTSANTCVYCWSGTFSAVGMSDCLSSCPVGTYTVSATRSCVDCDAGTYSAADSIVCKSCTAGKYSGPGAICNCKVGYTPSSDGVTCSACSVGTYKEVTGAFLCQPCPVGSWCTSVAKTSCPANTSSLANSSLVTNCMCNMGYTPSSGGVTCSACSVGTYKDVTGAGSCIPCPSGTSSGGTSQSITNCTCNAGYTPSSDGVACSACSVGTYKEVTGAFLCQPCTVGSWCTSVAKTSCPTNTSSLANSSLVTNCTCNAGYTASSDGVTCSACSVGTYKEVTGAFICKPCPTDSWCTSAVKTPCPANASSPANSSQVTNCNCNAGYTPSSDGVTCRACSVGTYKESIGVFICQTCPADSWCTSAVKTHCVDNKASSSGSSHATNCTCIPGYTASSDGVTCSTCSAGTYKDMVGNVACTTCPLTMSSVAGSSSLGDCMCSEGYTTGGGSDVACNACNAGSYKETIGFEECSLCPSGTTTWGNSSVLSGTTSRTGCICNTGYEAVSDGIECTVCVAGSYKTSVGAGHCSLCPSGTSSENGSTALDDCSCVAGYHADSNGVVCTLCEVGTFKSNNGTGVCLECLYGQISSNRISDCRGCPDSSRWDTELLDCVCYGEYVLDLATFLCVVSEEMKSRPIGSHCVCE
jgi:Tyrosine-protein kinase ephrin type A/B receptor-like